MKPGVEKTLLRLTRSGRSLLRRASYSRIGLTGRLAGSDEPRGFDRPALRRASGAGSAPGEGRGASPDLSAGGPSGSRRGGDSAVGQGSPRARGLRGARGPGSSGRIRTAPRSGGHRLGEGLPVSGGASRNGAPA